MTFGPTSKGARGCTSPLRAKIRSVPAPAAQASRYGRRGVFAQAPAISGALEAPRSENLRDCREERPGERFPSFICIPRSFSFATPSRKPYIDFRTFRRGDSVGAEASSLSQIQVLNLYRSMQP